MAARRSTPAGIAVATWIASAVACSDARFATTPPGYDAAPDHGGLDAGTDRGDTAVDRGGPPAPIKFSFPAGFALDTSTGLAVGDLDGDGLPDLVFVSATLSVNVTVVLNRGQRRLAPPVPYAIAGPPSSVAIGDTDGDGDADVVLATSNGFAVLPNQGDGRLGTVVEHAVARGVEAVVLADFDRDGKLDVVTTTPDFNSPMGRVAVMLADDRGGFAPPVFHTIGGGHLEIVAGDLDGDEWPDLVVAALQFRNDGQVAILRNLGNGQLKDPVLLPIASGYMGFALGDLDGDGQPDLAVGGSPMQLLMNRGAGRFEASTLDGRAIALAAADLDGDGRADLVALPGTDAGIDIRFQRRDGTAIAPINYLAPGLLRQVASADMDGDGAPDLVAASLDRLSVMYNDGHGRFDAPPTYPAGTGAAAVAVGDLNSDGIADLAVANEASGDVSALFGLSDDSFAPPVSYRIAGSPLSLALADFDSDGWLDIVAANNTTAAVTVLRNSGAGRLTGQSEYAAGRGPLVVAVGDLDGDGHPDLAIANRDDGTVTVRRNDGHGGFPEGISHAAGQRPVSVAIGDIDGDGRADLAVADGDSDDGLRVLLNRGDGSFHRSAAYGGTQGMAQAVAIADVDGDGRGDVAVAAFEIGVPDNLTLFLAGTGGVLYPGRHYDGGAVDYGHYSLAFGDMNDDGAMDLIVGAATETGFGGQLSVLLNRGNGTFTQPYTVPVGGREHASVALADLDHDGRLDVAVATGIGALTLRNAGRP